MIARIKTVFADLCSGLRGRPGRSGGAQYECHVINLTRQPEKYAAFLARNRVTGLEFRRFAAIDGTAVSREEFVRSGLLKSDAVYTQGAIGCAVSHLTLWRHAIAQRTNLLIFEDDAYCRHDIGAQVARLLAELRDWDVILLGCNSDAILSVKFSRHWSFAGYFSVLHPSLDQLRNFAEIRTNVAAVRLNNAFGTCAYLVSPRGAQKLATVFPLENRPVLLPRRETHFEYDTFYCDSIDTLMNTLYSHMSAYVAFPPLAMPQNDPGTSTTRQP